MNPQPTGFEYDTEPKTFIQEIFKSEPKLPFSFYLTLPSGVGTRDFLAYFITYGAKTLYDRQLAELSPEEIEHLRKYLLSIGWDVEYQVENREQTFETESADNQTRSVTRPVNYYLIDFKPADQALKPKVF